jgi:hypothetical protein
MPYIKQEDRDVAKTLPLNAGELNFAITELVLGYLASFAPSYQKFNDAVGALECAKAELYRRAIVPYEDKKIKENGDVYS